MNEIELKLTMDEKDVARVGRATAVRARSVTPRPRARRLVSTYFDTADQRLRGAGVAVRIRRVGRLRYLTVKAGQSGMGGMLIRREWEGRVSSETPDLSVVTDLELRRAVEIAAAGAPLAPVFTTTMSRTSRALDLGEGTTATLDMDRGTVATADAVEKVCEAEVELREGDPARLFAFAREFAADIPVRISTETKAARGFRLLGGALPQSVKAAPVDLVRGQTVEEALLVTLQSCLDQVFANDLPVLLNDEPEGVHQMRVGLRRLRSAMTLFGDVLPAEQRSALVAEVRWLTNQLGLARDADVQDAEVVGPVAARMAGDPAFARLTALLASERTSGRAAAREAVLSMRTTELHLSLSEWVSRRLWRDQPVSAESAQLFRPVAEFSCRMLARRHKKCVKRAKRFADLPVDELHELRKDLKKLRYACEFFRSLYGAKPVRAYTRRLSALQDSLGYLNDVAVAHEYVAGLLARAGSDGATDLAFAGGVVLGWHERALAEQEPATLRSIRGFLRATPFWK